MDARNTAHYLHYEAIVERNRQRLARLSRLASTSEWAKQRLPIRPRDLTVALLNGYRIEAGRGAAIGDDYRRQVRRITAAALRGEKSEVIEAAFEGAIYAARRHMLMLDPKRRGTDPDPGFSPAEHNEIENILTGWLFDTLQEFGVEEI